MGTQVEVIAFGKSASSKLREAADNFFDLSEDPGRYLMGYRETSTRDASNGKGRTRKAVSL